MDVTARGEAAPSRDVVGKLTAAILEVDYAFLPSIRQPHVFRDCMTDTAKIDMDQPHVPFFFIGAE